MFDVLIGNSQPSDATRVDAGVGGGFENCATETAGQRGFFDGEDKSALVNGFQYGFGIERLEESRVNHSDFESFSAELLRSFDTPRK